MANLNLDNNMHSNVLIKYCFRGQDVICNKDCNGYHIRPGLE